MFPFRIPLAPFSVGPSVLVDFFYPATAIGVNAFNRARKRDDFPLEIVQPIGALFQVGGLRDAVVGFRGSGRSGGFRVTRATQAEGKNHNAKWLQEWQFFMGANGGSSLKLCMERLPTQPSIEEALWAGGGGGDHVVLAGARISQPRDVAVGPANLDGLYGGGFAQPKV